MDSGAKRAVNVAGAALLIVLSGPIWVLAAVVICLSDGVPVLFRGDRIGLGGRVFQAYKFRTLARHTQPGAHGLAEAVPFNAFAAFLRALDIPPADGFPV